MDLSVKLGSRSVRAYLRKGEGWWLVVFGGLVRRGARSPSTLDECRHVVDRVVVPGVAEMTTRWPPTSMIQ